METGSHKDNRGLDEHSFWGVGGAIPSKVSPGRLMKISEIASVLRCSPRHVRRMALRGEFPEPVKIGRLRRWPREKFEAWLAGKTH